MYSESRMNRFGWVVTLLIVTFAFLDRIIPEGLFFDGLLYATIARNFSEGIGSFWTPQLYTQGVFYEHPPLMMYLESWFFRWLGDHLFTEKIYSAAIWTISLLLLALFHRKVSVQGPDNKMSWLPVLLWGVSPIVLFSYPNNLLEPTMALADMIAVLLIYIGLGKRNSVVYLSFGAVFIFFAALTKGFVGLFPLAVPFIYFLSFDRTKWTKGLLLSLFLGILLTIIFALVLLNPEAKTFLSRYLDEQVIASLAGEREKVDSLLGHFAIIPEMLLAMLPALALLVIVFLVKRKTGLMKTLNPERKRAILFFILVGLSASLPLMLSIKQRAFYLSPSMFYFHLAIALIIGPAIGTWLTRWMKADRFSIVRKVVIILFSAGSVIYFYQKVGTVGYNKDTIVMIKQVLPIIPEKERVGMCRPILKDWVLRSNLLRYKGIEAVDLETTPTHFALISGGKCPEISKETMDLKGYKRINLELDGYELFEKRE